MRTWIVYLLSLSIFFFMGCSSKMERARIGMMDQTDVEMVKSGLATPLLLLDGLNAAYPKSLNYKFTASQLYVAYGGLLFMQDENERAAMAFVKAKEYGFSALSKRSKKFKKLKNEPYEEFIKSFDSFKKKDVPYLYYTAQAWLGWIASSGSWAAAADAPKMLGMLELLLKLDENYDYGMTHCLLAAYHTARPEAFGGKPELAREHFEKALKISKGESLSIYVLYAKQYCRLLYNRELHDKLLNKVVEADIASLPKDIKFMNYMAQKQAKDLLASADDFF